MAGYLDIFGHMKKILNFKFFGSQTWLGAFNHGLKLKAKR
jgi:hypothetical protein